ncbi:MAG: hypothetical protein ACR2PK_01505 [Acidimicrobiales bacterium]
MDEVSASTTEPTPSASMDRRAMLRRLAATGAVAWAAPEILATRKASAMALSGCFTEYTFEGGMEGWTVNGGGGPVRWRRSSYTSFTGSTSMWFGRRNSRDSEYPVMGQDSYNFRNRASRGTLTSPATTISTGDVMQFHVRLAIESAAQYDLFTLYIVQGGDRFEIWSKDYGGFTDIPHPQQPGGPWRLYTTSQGMPNPDPDAPGWVAQTVSLSGLTGIDYTMPVQFEFDFQTVDGLYNRTEGIYLDSIMLPCAAPLAPSAPVAAVGRTAANEVNTGLSVEPPLQSSYLPGYRPPKEVLPPAKPRTPPPE